MTPADLRAALPCFEAFVQRFAPLLGDDSRPARAQAYLRGLLLDNDDNQTAEAIALKVHGQPSQVRMTQVFVSQSPWADKPLRNELAPWVDEEIGYPNNGGLVADESSFVKGGAQSRSGKGAFLRLARFVARFMAIRAGGGVSALHSILHRNRPPRARSTVHAHAHVRRMSRRRTGVKSSPSAWVSVARARQSMNRRRRKGFGRMAWVAPGGAQPILAARTTSREKSPLSRSIPDNGAGDHDGRFVSTIHGFWLIRPLPAG